MSVYLQQFYEVGLKQKKMSIFCTEYIIKVAATSVLAIFILFLGFSRVYLGAHSYN